MQDDAPRSTDRPGAVDARVIIDSALDAIVVADADNRIREFNPAAEAIFGWRREQVIGQALDLIIPPEMRERHRRGLDAHVRTGKATVLDRRLELEALRSDGSRFPMELSVSRGGPPDAPLFTAFIRDISLRNQQSRRLLEQSRRLRTLADCQRELAGLTTSVSDSYDRIARLAQQAMGADGAAFEVPEGDDLVYRASSGMAADAGPLRVPLEGSLSGLAFGTGETLVCTDAALDDRVDVAACRTVGLGSMVVALLACEGRKVGVVKVMAREPGRFTADDLSAMDVFVGSLAGALERIRRQQARDGALELRARILGIQQDLAASAAPLQSVMETLSRHALELTGADGAVVELIEGEDMVYAAASGNLKAQAGFRLRREGSLSGLCAREGRLLEAPDTSTDPRVDAAACRQLGVASIIVAPLLGMEGVVGVLKVVCARPHAFDAAHADALESVVHSMGVLIQRRAAADRIAASERRYRILFAQNPHPMWVYELQSLRFLEVNAAAVALYGYTREEFLAMTILDIRPTEDHEALRNFLKRIETIAGPTAQFQTRHRLKDGRLVDVEISGDDLEFDGRRARLVLAHDVTARRQAERDKARAEGERERVLSALEFAATHDALTGLPRFSTVQPWLERRMAGGEPAAILVVELDRFSALNQTLSHEVADEVLRQVGMRLGRHADEALKLCRLSADEFVALLPASDAQRIHGLAEALRAAVAAPIEAGGFRVNLTATVGVAISPAHGDNVTELLRRAEAAAEQGKLAGRDCVRWFSAEAMQAVEDRIILGGELRGAVERGELHLLYQPLFHGRAARPVGFEALLRWEHPQLGAVSPARFIPVAENLGLMGEIGTWVVQAACRQIRAWLDAGLGDFRVAVNVSSLQLLRPGLVATVRGALLDAHLPRGCLELEITESALMENLERAREKLRRFAELGVPVALDDFGTGYSSLAYLKELDLQKLKIDKSFVRGLPDDPRDAAMARTIVSIAHQFGLVVAAEGVETLAQAEFLESIGCDLLQGFLLSRPLPAEQAAALLATLPA